MPSGACVVVYEGKRGRVFRAKFRDTDGRQVQQTLGREADGWTERRAERELGKLLDKVERERWRKPTRERLSTLVDEYLDEYLPSRGRRLSTVLDYTSSVAERLPGPGGRLRSGRRGLVGSGAASDRLCAGDRAPARRDPRAAVGRCRNARAAPARPSFPGSRRDWRAEKQGWPAHDHVRA